MRHERVLLDTSFVLAVLNGEDAWHDRALALVPTVRAAREVVVTEAVLLEIGNHVSRDARMRQQVARLIWSYHEQPNCVVVPVDTTLFREALALYADHGDKAWGLTDCVSFVVMQQRRLVAALTGDRHFVQAGFVALLAD